MKTVLIIDLHCDALLPSGVGEFGGGNSYSRSVIELIASCKDIYCLYVTRKKIESLPDVESVADNIVYRRITLGGYSLDDKDVLHLHSDAAYDSIVHLLNQLNIDIDIIHSIYWPSGIVAKRLSDHYQVPFIHTVLSNGRRKYLECNKEEISDCRINYETQVFHAANRIICSSSAEQYDIINLYHIPKKKTILTGLKVDKTFKYPLYTKRGDFQLNALYANADNHIYLPATSSEDCSDALWWNNGAFLFYGRLHIDKGILNIVNSWLDLSDEFSDFPSLWIAGGSPEQIHAIRKEISSSSLSAAEAEGKLIWWGRLSADGLSTLLLKSSALVTCSKYESGGLMIMESFASGTPVIATAFGFAKDYVRDWKNGFIIDYNDNVLLKHRMHHFYQQPYLSAVLGFNACTDFLQIEKYFDFDKKHLALYCATNYMLSDIQTTNPNGRSNLPYPIFENIPSTTEILHWFKEKMKTIVFQLDGIGTILRVIETERYLILFILYHGKKYQCYRWKNYINMARVINPHAKYFSLARDQYHYDSQFYEILPENAPLFCDDVNYLSVHKCREQIEPPEFGKLFSQLQKLYLATDKIVYTETITFKAVLSFCRESIKTYASFFSNTESVLRLLANCESGFDFNEATGPVPGKIENNMLNGNEVIHIDKIVCCNMSYAFAQLVFLYPKQDWIDVLTQNIDMLAEDSGYNAKYWVLLLVTREFISSRILCTNDFADPISHNDLEILADLLEHDK